MFKYLKRAFDFLFALSVLALVAPILIIAMVLIKLESKGPVFFVQERLGYRKRVFKILKLRTMTHKIRESHVQVFKSNAEVTKVGYFLRRTKIDELPQFINVLVGDMAIVGPRPCLPSIEHLFDDNTDFRFQVKPGVTSLAGVSGSIYLSWNEKWLYDRIYVEKMSPWLDLTIIVKTLLVVILGEKRFLKHPLSHN